MEKFLHRNIFWWKNQQWILKVNNYGSIPYAVFSLLFKELEMETFKFYTGSLPWDLLILEFPRPCPTWPFLSLIFCFTASYSHFKNFMNLYIILRKRLNWKDWKNFRLYWCFIKQDSAKWQFLNQGRLGILENQRERSHMHQQHSACLCVYESRSVVSDSFATPWTVACQISLSMEFSRQEYCSGFPFPSPKLLHGEEQSPALESSCERPKKSSTCLAKHHTMKIWARRVKGGALTQEALFCLSKAGPPVGSNSGKQTHFLERDQLKTPDSGEKLKLSTVPPHYLVQRFEQ